MARPDPWKADWRAIDVRCSRYHIVEKKGLPKQSADHRLLIFWEETMGLNRNILIVCT
jgi:hypothetical protein